MRCTLMLACCALVAGCDAGTLGHGEPAVDAGARGHGESSGGGAHSADDAPALHRVHCGPGAASCAEATGRVLYVEAVDPDGDGDAHYVIAGGSVTAPGLSVIDVGRDVRPAHLPRVGDLVSAAGPVFTGSHGQRQIQAVAVNQRRRR